MIKGLAITPPALGRIAIGSVVEKNGKRLPVKEDFFTITSNVQGKDGWIKHPVHDQLLKASGQDKLRSIPVRLLFNDPALNLRAEYCFFDRKTGRPICVGNGETCRRYSGSGIQNLACPSPDQCEFADGGTCKPFGRLSVKLNDDDEFGTFIFRTTGYNSIRTLTARLSYYQATSGDRLACLPLQLKLRGKSTTMSHRSPVYYVDITIRDGVSLEQALIEAREEDAKRREYGFDQNVLDETARSGFKNGLFEEDSEQVKNLLDEFYVNAGELEGNDARQTTSIEDVPSNLTGKLNQILAKKGAKITIPTAALESVVAQSDIVLGTPKTL